MASKRRHETELDYCKRSFEAALNLFSSHFSPERWLIAHSGGIDSQLLLYLAQAVLPKDRILVVHINHHLQPLSSQWAQFSRDQAAGLGLAHCVLDVHPDQASEGAARAARYQALESLAKPGDQVLFGHHADDQAETLLYRLLRGSGLAGLGAIPQTRALGDAVLLRPLLSCSRVQIEAAATQAGLDYVTDPTNARDDYDRNFLRNRVIPLLKLRWPQLLQRWTESVALFAETNQLLEAYLDADLQCCSAVVDQFDLLSWAKFSPQKQPHLLRHWLLRSSGQRLNSQELQQIIRDVISAKADAAPEYRVGELTLRRYSDRLYLVPDTTGPIMEMLINADGDYDLGDGCLQIRNLPAGCTLSMRRRSGGEHCQVPGRGRRSVKKLLQEAQLPPWQREDWPLLYIGDVLIAVPGVCQCLAADMEENPDFSVLWRPFSLSGNS